MKQESKEYTLPSGRRLIEEKNDKGEREFILTSKDGQRVAAVLDAADIARMDGIVYPTRTVTEFYAAHPELNPCVTKFEAAINSACATH